MEQHKVIQAVSDRWEQGSFFHWMSDEAPDGSKHPWNRANTLCASGRDAFRVLIEHGVTQRGWKRLHVPCYYCQEVVASLVSTGIPISLYADGPEDPIPSLHSLGLAPGDVLLRVSFFGLRHSLTAGPVSDPAVEIIDDYSHDPWCHGAWHSDADWCVVSLRKTLPLPDGGVLWSPKAHSLPLAPNVTTQHRIISLEKLAAMVLKTEYLRGKPLPKETYRQLAVSSEEHLSQGPVSGMPEWSTNLLECLPAATWRNQRQANHSAFSQELANAAWARVLQVSDASRTCPFSAIVILENRELRDHIRTELISRRIYPTILWPLDKPVIDQVPAKYVDFGDRMMSIQCDARYSPEDMAMIARVIAQCGDARFRQSHARIVRPRPAFEPAQQDITTVSTN